MNTETNTEWVAENNTVWVGEFPYKAGYTPIVIDGQPFKPELPKNSSDVVKYVLTLVARAYYFSITEDPVSDDLGRTRLKDKIESLLRDLRSKRVLHDFLVICDASNNTSNLVAANVIVLNVGLYFEIGRPREFSIRNVSDTYSIEHPLEDYAPPIVNPKELVALGKITYSALPSAVVAEVGLAMLEGELKHGASNFLASPIRAKVYYDSTRRHIEDWWRGRDIDPTCNVHEITKAIASLMVLRAAMINGNFVDDRPPPPPEEFFTDLEKRTRDLIEQHKDKTPRHYTIADASICRKKVA